jgi:hypothetical protein
MTADSIEEKTSKPSGKQDVAKVVEANEVKAPEIPEVPAGSHMKFAVADLIARAPEYLGMPHHIAAGGLADQEDDMTLHAASSAIANWLQKPVAGQKTEA